MKREKEENKQKQTGRKEKEKIHTYTHQKNRVLFSRLGFWFCSLFLFHFQPSLSPVLEVKNVTSVLQERKLRHREATSPWARPVKSSP